MEGGVPQEPSSPLAQNGIYFDMQMHVGMDTYIHAWTLADSLKQTRRPTTDGKQAGRQADRQTDRTPGQTDRQAKKQMVILIMG